MLREPEDVHVPWGGRVSFSLQVEGYPTPSVTWYKNGRVLSGETGESLSVVGVQWFHRGGYSARLSNSEGSVETRRARLSIDTEDKWNFLVNKAGASLPLETGKIDRDLGLHRGGGER